MENYLNILNNNEYNRFRISTAVYGNVMGAFEIVVIYRLKRIKCYFCLTCLWSMWLDLNSRPDWYQFLYFWNCFASHSEITLYFVNQNIQIMLFYSGYLPQCFATNPAIATGIYSFLLVLVLLLSFSSFFLFWRWLQEGAQQGTRR